MMARIRPTRPRLAPLTDEEMDAETRTLVSAGALNIFRTLARHPKLLKRWLVFGNHVLAKSTLPERERELAILRVGLALRRRVRVRPAHHHRSARRASPTTRSWPSPARSRTAAGATPTAPCSWPSTSSTTTSASPTHDLGLAGPALGRAAAPRPRLHRRPVHAGVDGAEQPRRRARRRRPRVPRPCLRDVSPGRSHWSSAAARRRGRPPATGAPSRAGSPPRAPRWSSPTASSTGPGRRWPSSRPTAAPPSPSPATSPPATTAPPWSPPPSRRTAASTWWSTTSGSGGTTEDPSASTRRSGIASRR